MTVRAQVVNGDTMETLESATAQVVNAAGQYLGQGVKADNTGKFALTSDILSGNYLAISYTGLESLMIAADLLTGTNYKIVKLYPRSLDEVVVIPGKRWPWWAWPAIVVVGVGIARMKKRRPYAR